ncbi:hypothetical protein QYE76_004321 [Lolium multiflorum]|uniref:NB-ARC domain-containing protein n=1 Tax=Lolium multiflorum TaxID=4521 RepID=A0AAD8RQE8_LOLMU|nr:hypothetical protein QYE76_004321 [Lolium multiflorum]
MLVLDDVWTAEVWAYIRNVFPTGCPRRIVFTSRNHEVSLLASTNCVLHLEPLEAYHSWVLFCREAFWNAEDKACPLDLQKLAQKFVSKCKGLPIAIACIGRLLSCKPPTPTDWGNVYRDLELQLSKDVIPDLDMILKVSLEDLPYDLKNCFLHCALLPEDYSIKRRKAMRHWIAAGFIREKENKTLEEVAEGYLTELVNRSLLQVAGRNGAGRLKCCRMHDVIRLLALNKAKEECFSKVYDGSRAFSVEAARRISIQSEKLDHLGQSGTTSLRALHVFERYINIDLLKPILTSSHLLSTLDLEGTCIKMLPNEVFNLFNLRYLGLRDTAIGILPEAIGRLQNLQVLDVVNSDLSYLPKNIAKLQKLRYLYADTVARAVQANLFGGVKVPNGIRNLTALQALQSVKASSEILCEVGALTELRTFAVSNVKTEHSANLSNAIIRMSHLVHLEIAVLGQKEVLHLEGLCLPPTLSWLALEGQLEKTSMPQVLSSWSHLNSLTRLHLSLSKIDEGSFSGLLMLRNLCSLALIDAFEGKKLHFCAGSFPKLRYLFVHNAPRLNQSEIEEGSMQCLALLVFRDCPELKLLPHGIEHLTGLEELRLEEASEELLNKLQQKGNPNECSEDLLKISRIRKVTVELTKKGISERIR